MPKATRKGDIGSGHGCFPPSSAIEGSPDVFINGKLAVRVGDAFAAHGCGKCAPHGRNAAQGSATVNINGKPSVRVGDAINCGGSAATGSGNVFIGDLSWGGQISLPVKTKLRHILSQIPGSDSEPYIYEPYKLYKDGALIQQGKTGEDGSIEFEADPPVTGDYTIVLETGERFTLSMQALSPNDTETGRVERRHALGYGSDRPEADGNAENSDHLKGLIP
jgi:uncharacterized Zn-binding protein involved in type VI secretion